MTGAAGAKAPSPYFVSPVVDFLLIGGVSLATYVALLLTVGNVTPSDRANALAGLFTWVINHPHFSATSYRLFRSRDAMRQYPLTTYGIPLVVLGWVVASLFDPHRIAPIFMRIYIIWSPYHFAGQSLGVTLLYMRRAGVNVSTLERWVVMGFIYLTFISAQARAEQYQPANYHDIRVPALFLPSWITQATEVAMFAFAALFAACAIARWQRGESTFPAIAFLPMLSQFVWFAPRGRFYVPTFDSFVPLFHSLQYLFIAWMVQLRESRDETGAAPSPPFVLNETLRWAVLNFLGGALLFVWIPELLARGLAIPIGIATPIFIAGVQVHHFFVDGVIWKIRNPRSAGTLLVRLEDVLGAPAEAKAAAA